MLHSVDIEKPENWTLRVVVPQRLMFLIDIKYYEIKERGLIYGKFIFKEKLSTMQNDC